MLINLLQRHHLWIFIVLSGLSGLALGNLAATTIGILAHPLPSSASLQQTTPERAKARPTLASYQEILNRDIFNSAAKVQSLTHPEPARLAKSSPVKTASKWTLIGTISGGQSPLATLSNNKEITSYRLKEELPDGAKLAVIDRNRVELHYPDGRVQVLEPTASEIKPQAISRPSTKRTANKGTQIENLGGNRWHIPAQVAEDARSNIGNLLSQAQAFPYLEGEQTTGFQIRMIKPGSLIAQLGLQRGDILREVNGLPLNSPEKALQIFGQLRQAKQISIGLERRGKAMTFAYEIR